ncbi:MAG: GNAT family N-acetyltransferase [Legionellaceae bacterium]|nr:GNAT family N-acetyltransferase [Legionellaceae bacterium]
MEIRDVKVSDAYDLIQLLSQMGYDLTLDEMKGRIKAFKTQHHQLLVIEVSNQVIAAIAFGCYEQLRLTGRCCHIDTLVVDKQYQGQGLGKRLLSLAEHYAMEKGAKTVELISANHRKKEGTHAFYEALNYENHVALDCAYFAKEKFSSLNKK